MTEPQDNQPNNKEESCKCTGKCKKYPWHDSSDKYYKLYQSQEMMAEWKDPNPLKTHLQKHKMVYAVAGVLLLLNWDVITHTATNFGEWFALERNNIGLALSIVLIFLLTRRKS